MEEAYAGPFNRAPWAHRMARVFAVSLAAVGVAHATRDVWWPHCQPDQLLIDGTSVAGRMQSTEASLKGDERYEVTTFVTVETGEEDGLQVTTGTKWTSMSARAPARAYCYASLPGLGRQAVVDLAERLGWGGVTPASISDEQAAFVNRSAADLAKLAESHCRWMEEKNQ